MSEVNLDNCQRNIIHDKLKQWKISESGHVSCLGFVYGWKFTLTMLVFAIAQNFIARLLKVSSGVCSVFIHEWVFKDELQGTSTMVLRTLVCEEEFSRIASLMFKVSLKLLASLHNLRDEIKSFHHSNVSKNVCPNVFANKINYNTKVSTHEMCK